jgi:Raf kinase inhibitor-like YbhB/YbcL family protein
MALIVTDGDAANSPVIHWIVWDIPPQTQTIAAGMAPAGAVVGMNDFGDRGYDGPAPPSGVHHYRFHLYALNGMLSLPPDTKREDLLAAFENHTLSDVNLMGTFAAP